LAIKCVDNNLMSIFFTDDCISPGYHAALPMEVHGSCYSNMQTISEMSYNTLKCPGVVITQNSFDLESFTFYVANTVCMANGKKYGILYDSAYEIIHVSKPTGRDGMLCSKLRFWTLFSLLPIQI
jgi:hypothetical protein